MFKKLKQNSNWIIELFVMMFICFFILFRGIGNADELWIFSYAKNAADGLKLYKDINICVTPFAINLLTLALKIFGSSLWVYRVITCLLYGTCYLFGSRILWQKSNKNIPIHIMYSLFFMSMNQIMLYEYNIVNVLLLMIIIYLDAKGQSLKEHKKSTFFNKDVLIGILTGLVVMTKHSTGLILIICVITNAILNRVSWKNALNRFIGFISIIATYLTIFALNGSLLDMYDLTIAGLGNFTQNMNRKLIFSSFLVHPELLLIVLYYIFNLTKMGINFLMKKEITIDEQNKRTAFIYILTSFCIVYPLLDYTHFAVACVPLLPYLFDDIKLMLKKEKKIYSIPFYFFFILWFIWNIFIFDYSNYFNLNTCKLNHYEGINIHPNTEQMLENIISKVEEYKEKGLDVYIFDVYSIASFTPLDMYHKYYDLMLTGNTGTADMPSLIKEKCTEGNVIFYIKDEEKGNYQMPKGIKQTLKENGMVVVDECMHFDIYMYSGSNV